MAQSGTAPDDRDKRIIGLIVANRKPVMGTTEIAEHFDMSQQGISRHLNRLHDEGALNTEKIGRVRVWWPTEDGLSYLESL